MNKFGFCALALKQKWKTTMKKILLFITLASAMSLIIGCAPALGYHAMPSISEKSSTAPSAFVLLAVGDSNNVIGIQNDSLFFEYNIYKKNSDGEDYQQYETIHVPTEPYNIKAMMFPYRDKVFSLNDRYMIKPVLNGEEQGAIPVAYYTMDSLYYSEIEHSPIESTEGNINLYRPN